MCVYIVTFLKDYWATSSGVQTNNLVLKFTYYLFYSNRFVAIGPGVTSLTSILGYNSIAKDLAKFPI